jgi:hypothetical protein
VLRQWTVNSCSWLPAREMDARAPVREIVRTLLRTHMLNDALYTQALAKLGRQQLNRGRYARRPLQPDRIAVNGLIPSPRNQFAVLNCASFNVSDTCLAQAFSPPVSGLTEFPVVEYSFKNVMATSHRSQS